VVVTRSSNNYGPYQFPEKLIPLFTSNLLDGKKVPIYGDGKNVRDWCHVADNCAGVDLVLRQGATGEIYNIGAGNEFTNLELTHALLELTGCDESMIAWVDDRLGHDRRYAIDSSKLKEDLGWVPEESFQTGIEKTLQWYLAHQAWIDRVRSGFGITMRVKKMRG